MCELGRERFNRRDERSCLLPDGSGLFESAFGASWRVVEISNPYLLHQNHQGYR
jgi:hypothetical protein